MTNTPSRIGRVCFESDFVAGEKAFEIRDMAPDNKRAQSDSGQYFADGSTDDDLRNGKSDGDRQRTE